MMLGVISGNTLTYGELLLEGSEGKAKALLDYISNETELELHNARYLEGRRMDFEVMYVPFAHLEAIFTLSATDMEACEETLNVLLPHSRVTGCPATNAPDGLSSNWLVLVDAIVGWGGESSMRLPLVIVNKKQTYGWGVAKTKGNQGVKRSLDPFSVMQRDPRVGEAGTES